MLTQFKEERGVAILSVIMVTMVLVLLSMAAYQLSIGNLSRSVYDQERDRAIQAAQSAVNSYLAALQLTTKVCNGVGTTLTLTVQPSVTYSVSKVFWITTGGTPISCANQAPTTSQVKSLKNLVVTGTGTAGAGQQVVTRKWQTLVDLSVIAGDSVAAFYGNTGLCISNGPNMVGLPAATVLDTPNFMYTASDWSGAYTVVNESSGDCTAIASDITTKITNGVSGKYDLVFYVNPGCALSWPMNSSFALKGNTIIITRGSFSSSNTSLTTASGSCSSSATDNRATPCTRMPSASSTSSCRPIPRGPRPPHACRRQATRAPGTFRTNTSDRPGWIA